RRPDIAPDPADRRAEPEEGCRDEDALGRAALVVRVADAVCRIARHDDRDPGRGRMERAGLGHASIPDGPQGALLTDDDEPPRLAVPAAARPAGDVGDRIELGDG